jgi:hypothetical protein
MERVNDEVPAPPSPLTPTAPPPRPSHAGRKKYTINVRLSTASRRAIEDGAHRSDHPTGNGMGRRENIFAAIINPSALVIHSRSSTEQTETVRIFCPPDS